MGFLFGYGSKLRSCHPGYESDERSSLGERGDRCQWQMKGAERVAAVGVQRRRAVAEAHTGHRNRAIQNALGRFHLKKRGALPVADEAT